VGLVDGVVHATAHIGNSIGMNGVITNGAISGAGNNMEGNPSQPAINCSASTLYK